MCRFRSSDPCLQAMHRWGVSCGSKRPHWNSAQSSWKGRRVFVQNWPGRTRLWHHWMWTPACPGWQNFFCGWVQDYRTLAQVQHQKHFFFIPQGSINTPQEFAAALQAYAEEHGMQLSLTKEGMYPEFSLDGILYKAYRNPGKYRDEICCDAASPEQLNTGLPSRRERQLQVLRILLPAAFTFAAILAAGWVATGGADWLWLAALAAAGVLLGRGFEHRL